MIARRLVSMVLVWLCGVAGGLLLSSAPALAQREHAFGFSFGSKGSEPGQFLWPGPMAVNEVTHDVYAIDWESSPENGVGGRVEVFNGLTGAYISQFTPPTGPFRASFSDEEGAIAVDNSTNPLDPSAGDVYVLSAKLNYQDYLIDKFSASGAYIGQFTLTSSAGYELDALGVAVDANGSVWVPTGTGNYYVFNDALVNELISSSIEDNDFPVLHAFPRSLGMAIDSEGNLYMGYSLPPLEPPKNIVAKFTSAGGLINDEFDTEDTTAFAVDRSSNDLYVDNVTSIAAFGPVSAPIERFGSGQLGDSRGVAVDSSTGTVYASDAATDSVDVFTAFVVPDVSTGSVSSFGETSVTVSGVVDPDGLPVTSCVVEYGTEASYGQSQPCTQTPEAIGSGSAAVAVSANLTGLERLTTYHFRLKVANANGSNAGLDRRFLTPEAVAVSEEAVSDVSSGSALFSALVNPGGSDTTFRFEYGPSVAYGESVPVPDGDLGGGLSAEPVAVRAVDLLAGSTYHVRLVASNALGVVYGPDETFTTQEAGGAFALADGREWEMVSPPSKDGSSIEPPGVGFLEMGLVQAAENGSAIAYIASGPLSGAAPGNPGPGLPSEMLSRRGGGGSGPEGWSTREISTPRTTAGIGYPDSEFRAFSGDLSGSLVDPTGENASELPVLSPEATEPTPYLRDDVTGSYLPLVTAGNVPPGTQFSTQDPGSSAIENEDVHVFTATPDLSHVVLSSPDALTANAKPSENRGNRNEDNIYEWAGGRLKLVSVLPDGEGVSSGTIGGRGAISTDGLRVFWRVGRRLYENRLYMRDTVTEETVQVGTGRYQIASADGSKVFFTGEEGGGFSEEGGNLYVTDTLTGTTTDLTGEAGGMKGEVLGIGEDGSVVYFVATGVLAGGAEAGQPNLYVASETGSVWSTRLVAVLSGEDAADWQPVGLEPNDAEWWGGPVRVSLSGRFLAFMSQRSLTGYDNHDINGGALDEEVFLYDNASGGHLACVSCNPTGERPAGHFDGGTKPLSDRDGVWGGWLAADLPVWPITNINESGAFKVRQPRYLSDEGRLFFNGFDPLVPQATNGKANVYEYEPAGVGSCTRPGGCVSLISSGTSSEESVFMEASENGDDAFFLTTSKLVPQALENNLSMYDAHVCTTAQPCVASPVSPPACSSGDACKAAPSPQPAIFGAPASATFSGTGNLPPAPVVKTKAKPAKCKKGFMEKNGKCKRKGLRRGGKQRTRAAKSSRGGER